MINSVVCGALCTLQCLLNLSSIVPPCAGKGKHPLISSVLTEWLNQWRSNSGIMNLWQDACCLCRETHFSDVAVSEEALAKDNA